MRPSKFVEQGLLWLRRTAILQIFCVGLPVLFTAAWDILPMIFDADRRRSDLWPEIIILWHTIRILYVSFGCLICWSQQHRALSKLPEYMFLCELAKSGLAALSFVWLDGPLFGSMGNLDLTVFEPIYMGIVFGVPLVFAMGLRIYVCTHRRQIAEESETEPLLG